MSGRKRQKIDPSPSVQPTSRTVEASASMETTWLYKYSRSPYKYMKCLIYNIIPNCGVNFMEKAYEYDKVKETLEIFCLPKQQAKSLKEYCENNQLYYPGSELEVIAPKNRANWLRFALYERNDMSKRNMMSLSPITITLDGPGGRIDLAFHPGVQGFDPEMNYSFIEHHVAYHALFTATDARWSNEWSKTLKLKSPLKIVGVKAFPICSKGNEVGYKMLQNPFTLVSNDGVKRVCHKDVLCDRSPYFAKKLIHKVIESQMVVSESSHATNLLLEHIYNPLTQLPPDLSLKELCGVLRLAVEFQLFELIASTSNRLFRKIDKADNKSLWYLSATLYPLRYKVQILHNLWSRLLIKIRRCILKTESVYFRFMTFDDENYFLNLMLFAECGPHRYELLKGMCTDLEERRSKESQEEYLKIQLLFKRFLSEVLVESLKNTSPNSTAESFSSRPI